MNTGYSPEQGRGFVRPEKQNLQNFAEIIPVISGLTGGSETNIVNARALQMFDDKKGVNLTYTPDVNQNMSIISESGFYKLIARSRKATTPGTFAHRFSNWVFRNVIPGIRKTGAYGIPWGALQDFSRRKEQYQISASEKGRELQACKRKKRELEEEEKRLIREYQPEFYFGNRIQ